ncbi:hypothetical protein [Roseateles oligotrophus]|uniref:Uncharacterized protein n=1 Tax=Roseateles oligotrophus TaxID=1769250 RepID=A0ABT2YEB4_9BURK|nr:hypothetical protein [Roseateles oligotrophus]MCV2368335.1 hypothetical protein [Roseateles oligotrophus]
MDRIAELALHRFGWKRVTELCAICPVWRITARSKTALQKVEQTAGLILEPER